MTVHILLNALLARVVAVPSQKDPHTLKIVETNLRSKRLSLSAAAEAFVILPEFAIEFIEHINIISKTV